MAKESRIISFAFDYDPDLNNGMPVSNFLYHLLNSLDRENDALNITKIFYNGATKNVDGPDDLRELALRHEGVDSIDDDDKPKVLAESEDVNM